MNKLILCVRFIVGIHPFIFYFLFLNAAFIITGNNIGGDNSTGTGTYTLAGTTAHQYCGIFCVVGVGTPTLVQNNTIANIAMSSGSTSAAAMSGITSNGGYVDILNNPNLCFNKLVCMCPIYSVFNLEIEGDTYIYVCFPAAGREISTT